MKGHFIEFDRQGPFGHSFGGEHHIAGAWCPNCDKPLMLHLTLDTADLALNLQCLGVPLVPVLYCMKCALSWHDFSYRLHPDGRIEIVEAFEGERMWDDWNKDIGVDTFSRRPVNLRQIPDRLQELWDKCNSPTELTRDEEIEVATFTDSFALPDVGGYPIVNDINQVGGRAFMFQRLDDPACPTCTQDDDAPVEMYFLATLRNDADQCVKITFDGVQIVCFICPWCATIKVVHCV